MAIFLSRQKASGSATPITPSNANPVTLTANNPVNPTTNGKAVESVTNITPSNASPVSLSSGEIYKPSANGKAVESITNLDPSGYVYAQALTEGAVYKANTNGVAVGSYHDYTPSASGAALELGFAYIRGSGYAYNSKLPNFMSPDKTQVISSSTGGTTNISVTQKPRYIVMATWNAAGSQYGGMLGIVDVTNNTAKRIGYSSSSISWSDWSGYTGYFTSITSSQVTYKSNWSTNTATRSMILIYY